MTGNDLRTLREAHGWAQRQVGEALHYARSTVADWEHGRKAIPPDAAAWFAALPPVHASRAYPPTTGGLRMWMCRHDVTPRELAEFCGVGDGTAAHWCTGARRLPLAVRAWLRAGAPARWDWAPPGLPLNRIAISGKTLARPARVRPAPASRGPRSRLLRRWAAAARPRPWRRQSANDTTQEIAS